MTSTLFSKTAVLECISDEILVLTCEIDESNLELEQMSISSSMSPDSKPTEMLNHIHKTCNRKRTFPKYCCLDDEVKND